MNSLLDYQEVCKLIQNGERLLLAGDFDILKKVPKGNWIGGTIPYFMSELGGVKTREKIFTTTLPREILEFKISEYSENNLQDLSNDYFSNGFSNIIIPSFSKIHTSFAENCANYKNLFSSPLIGWVAGFDLDNDNIQTGFVFNGQTGENFNDRAIVMHLLLDSKKKAKMDIINLFQHGNGDLITFDQRGFLVKDCRINGEIQNFSEYLIKNEVDITLPLVTDFRGYKVNASFKAINFDTDTVEFYAPIFEDTEYQLASPIGIYEDEFKDEVLKNSINPFFSCNCILNYLYANLEGKKTGNLQGPMTFGEIAHILLNQTMVYISIEDA